MFDLTTESTALNCFADERCEAIQNAAYLLGGRPWLRRSQRLLDSLRNGSIATQRCIREAKALLDLFMLEHVHDLDRPESGYFALLDPEMPYVEEICLLADQLATAIEETEKTMTPGTSGVLSVARGARA